MDTTMEIMVDKPARAFPKPMINLDKRLIVFFEKKCVGQVIWAEDGYRFQEVGYISDNWGMDIFVDIPGKSLNINFNFDKGE